MNLCEDQNFPFKSRIYVREFYKVLVITWPKVMDMITNLKKFETIFKLMNWFILSFHSTNNFVAWMD